ncbi:MAG: carboxypeptidase regulatory-like domain-containing protein [Planctomycetes bacterium]|nr:carboxypeptidase regulatory-like domain-containing protein [Planctomycetota bacterium]
MRRWLLLGGLAVLGVLVLIAFRRDRPAIFPAPERDSDRQPPISAEGPDRLAVSSDPTPTSLPVIVGQEPARAVVGSTLRVLGAGDQAIEGVEISWTALRVVDTTWPWIDPAPLLPARERGSSDHSGMWSYLPPPSEPVQASVVWLTHHAHAARAFVLRAGEGPETLPTPLRLDPASGLEVLVVGPDGEPAQGVEVHQRLELEREDRGSFADPALEARAALWRVAVTDASGQARLAPLPGRQAVHAQAAERRSLMWRGAAPARLTLTLADLLTCAGRVVREDPAIDLAGTTVRAFARVGGASKRLGATTIASDGRLIPFHIPRVEGESYDFEISGGGVVPATTRVTAPGPGGRFNLELVARRGTKFPVQVLDPDGLPVPGAAVGWAWLNAERVEWWRLGSDPDGRCEADCVPVGRLWLEVTKSGFLPFREELEHSGDFSPAYEARLERGGVLRGRATANGEPVREFRVVITRSDNATHERIREHLLNDVQDGQYELDGIPLGGLAVFAFGEGRTRTATRMVTVTPDAPVVVDFELPAPVEVNGVVRDVLTHQPISGAKVQSWIDCDVAVLRAWGPVVQTDAEGRFSIPGAPPDARSTVEVRADGYATGHASKPPMHGAPVDVGTIYLGPPASLEVLVTGDDQIAAADVHASMHGSEVHERRRATPEGRIRFPETRAEDISLTLDAGTEWSLRFQFRLSPGRQEVMSVNTRRLRDLAVLVRASPGITLPTGCTLCASYLCRTARRPASWCAFVPDSGLVDIGWLDGAPLALEVLDPSGRSLASGVLADPDREGPVHVLEVGGPDRVLRIVDREGEPVSRVTVSVARIYAIIERSRMSDVDGSVRLESFTADRAHIHMYLQGKGSVLLREVALRRDVTDVEFDPRARVHLRLVDGADPTGGLVVNVFDGYGGGFLVDRITSGADGTATGTLLAADAYELVIDQPGVWPLRRRVEVREEAELQTIQVRRLGGLDLRVRSRGALLSECAIQLESEEFGTSIDAWCAEGRCPRTPADGRTDAGGRLVVDGLPRGEYRWTALPPGGEAMSGRVVVEAGRRALLELNVP